MTPLEKLHRARTMLILGDGDEPFFGSVAIGLDLVEKKRCYTAATDGEVLIYNPDWIQTMSIEETMALFEHEVYHVALKHARLMRDIIEEPDFDNSLFQQACDIPIDNRLIKKGRKLPKTPDGFEHVYNKEYEDMSAIRIYRMLVEKKQAGDSKPCDGNSQPCNDGQSSKIGDEDEQENDAQAENSKESKADSQDEQDSVGKTPEPEDLVKETGGFGGILPLLNENLTGIADKEAVDKFEKDFELKIANASRILQKELESSIGDLPEFIQEVIEAHMEPQRTYRDFIADFLEEITRDDYCWAKPNIMYEDVYVPTLSDRDIKNVAVIIDTSGSISIRELKVYASELSGIIMEFDDCEIDVIFHNTQAYLVEKYTESDLPIKFDKTQSGGTSYIDAYRKIEELEDEPAVIFHFTDLDCYQYPETPPEAKVFFMNTRHSANLKRQPPFGEVIKLEM